MCAFELVARAADRSGWRQQIDLVVVGYERNDVVRRQALERYMGAFLAAAIRSPVIDPDRSMTSATFTGERLSRFFAASLLRETEINAI